MYQLRHSLIASELTLDGGRPSLCRAIRRCVASSSDLPHCTLQLDVQRPWPGDGIPDDGNLLYWAEVALDGERSSVELLIRIVGEDESSELNRRFRGVNRPTNVLAFPLDPPTGVANRHLGDLVICAPVVQREARMQGKFAQAHWAHMVVHGVSHLLGYDHGDDVGAQVMEQREIRLMAQMGFADPYNDVANA